MIALKSFLTAKAFVVFLKMASEKRRHLQSRNVMRSMRCAVQNKGITINKIYPYGAKEWNVNSNNNTSDKKGMSGILKATNNRLREQLHRAVGYQSELYL